MKRLRVLSCIVLLGPLLPPAGQAAATNAPARAQVLDVLVTAQTWDERLPWRYSRPAFRQGYGVAVGGGRVLTIDELVRQATLVELRVPGSSAKYAARVLQAGPQVGLALLGVEDPAFLRRVEPVNMAAHVARGARTRIVQFDDAGAAQEGQGRVVELGVEALPAAPGGVLMMRVLSDLRVMNTGAAVFSDGTLLGILQRYDLSRQAGYILPAPQLASFLREASQPRYTPPPFGGFSWAPLVDPVRRRFFHAPEGDAGVQVVQVFSNSSAAAALRANDVLLRWDGFAVDSQGYYADPEYGRIELEHAISGRHRVGDRVAVELLRNGQPVEVSLTLQPYLDADALIPENMAGVPPAYLVEGGLVIRELSGGYLRAGGGRALSGAHPRLAHLYLTKANQAERPGEHVVILSGVLPDPINIGYQELHDEAITAVNGQPVRNLRDVMRIVDQDHGLARVTLLGVGFDLVLDVSRREAANARIARAYRIAELRREWPDER